MHERKNSVGRSIYPDGMHTTIAEGIAEKREFDVRTATLEVYPIYHHPVVRQVLRNAVRWAAPKGEWIDSCPQIPAAEAPEPPEIKSPRMHKKGEAGLR